MIRVNWRGIDWNRVDEYSYRVELYGFFLFVNYTNTAWEWKVATELASISAPLKEGVSHVLRVAQRQVEEAAYSLLELKPNPKKRKKQNTKKGFCVSVSKNQIRLALDFIEHMGSIDTACSVFQKTIDLLKGMQREALEAPK